MSDDQIREIFLSATEPHFWREFKDDDARERHLREIEWGFDKAHITDRLETKALADVYATDRRKRMLPFWLAWHYLRENHLAVIVRLPTPSTDPQKIDPDATAEAVREALAMLSSQTAGKGDSLPKRSPEFEAVYAYLVTQGQRVGAKLFRFMENRSLATFNEIVEHVYEGEEREWTAVVSVVRRLQDSLSKCLDANAKSLALRTRFSWSDSDFTVTKIVK